MSDDWTYNPPPDYHPNRRPGHVPVDGAWDVSGLESPGGNVVRNARNKYRYGAGGVDIVVPLFFNAMLGDWSSIPILLLVIANSVVLQGLTGQSIGKRICGDIMLVYVVNDDDNFWDDYCVPGIGRCAWRFVCHGFDLIFFWGFLVRPLYNGKGRTYADTLAKTTVVRQSKHNLSLRTPADARRDRDERQGR